MLDSLNAWRAGWSAAGNIYDIYAYASVNKSNWNEVRAACYLLNGLYIGLSLPLSAQNQSTWDVVDGQDAYPGSWGGHCVYVKAYNNDGLTCVTWGKSKKMTWPFFQKYCDECFGIIDNRNSWMVSSPLDLGKLASILNEITGGNIPPPEPTPPPAPVHKCWLVNLFGGK
jgi:hypothetical protein